MFRKILKSVFILIGIIVLILFCLYLIPPQQEEIQYDYVNLEQNPLINSNVGWYTAENGNNYQITWGAKQGLQLNFFDNDRNNLKNLRLTHIDEDKFDTDGNLQTAEVRFKSQNNDSILILDVKTSKTEFTAIKRNNEFYNQEEIEYFNGDTRLAGLLMTPINNSKSTAVVFIHGSGVSDRDSFWYMHQADYLARNGFIVLLPDKRGCGKSSGEWHTASFNDFADDISAGLEYLSNKKQAEFTKKGIIGISQGGWISHIVNQDNDGLDFVIDVVGSSTTPNEQVKFEVMNETKNSGVPESLAKPISLIFAKRVKAKRKIWWDKNGEFDPISLMSISKTPTLKIFGDEDENVPVKRSQEKISDLLSSQPYLTLQVKIFEASGHGLINQDTKWIREDYLEFMNSWITKL
jgi:pimeloyl-ACP methyl ester carboxylesterase